MAENREADAAALLERSPAPESAALHREIALRVATRALDAHDISAATAWLDRGLAVSPTDPELNFFRGNRHLDTSNPIAAIECFSRAISADPQRREFALALASALLANGTPDRIPAVLAQYHDSAQAQLVLAQAFELTGKLEMARAACERAGRLQPGQPQSWDRLAQLCERTGDSLGALVARTRAAAIRTTAPRHQDTSG